MITLIESIIFKNKEAIA